MLSQILISPRLWVVAAFLQTVLGKFSLALMGSIAVFCLCYAFLLGFAAYIGWLLLGCFLFLFVCISCGAYIVRFWNDDVSRKITSLQYNDGVRVTIQQQDGSLFGYRIDVDSAHYFLVLRLQRPRSYSFPGSQRIPPSARVVILEFVDDELDVFWSFRNFGWSRFG